MYPAFFLGGGGCTFTQLKTITSRQLYFKRQLSIDLTPRREFALLLFFSFLFFLSISILFFYSFVIPMVVFGHAVVEYFMRSDVIF